MNTLAVSVFVAFTLALPVAAQDRPGRPPSGQSSNDNKQDSHTPPRQEYTITLPRYKQSAEIDSSPPGIGICLIGDNYGYIGDPSDADKCDAVMWVDAIKWAGNQRKLIDQSTLTGTGATSDDGAVSCRSCTGTCQTVSLPIEDSTYEDVEVDGGQSPSECLTGIKEICESGAFRHFANARCGN